MRQISNTLVRRLQARTGADADLCRRTLHETGGDLELAAQVLFSLVCPGSLKNQFLIAMPSLLDEYFAHTVSLMCEHNDKGAVGLAINKPTSLPLNEMLDQMGIEHKSMHESPPVYWGGPIQPERGFVVHRQPGDWDSSLQLADELFITTSRDILTSIGQGDGPDHYLVALGYSGWESGQLESEILLNSWLNTPADLAILFQAPAHARWRAATQLLGVDVTQLAAEAGHA